MKHTVWKIYKLFQHHILLVGKKIARNFLKTKYSKQDLYDIPVIINNRNRLTYLKQLIGWFEKSGMKNIVILDNDSTYAPLLEYYKLTNNKVVFLKKNVGYTALWDLPIFDEYKKSYYIYTDPDVLPVNDCPINMVEHLYDILKKYPEIEKVGLGLKIDDLPEHYAPKVKVLELEKKYWSKQIETDLYNAQVDTTLALYRPLAKGNAETCKAYRTGGKYILRHLPWYENSASLSEEENFYISNVSNTSAYWSNLEKNK